MDIFFSPEYKGHVFRGLERSAAATAKVDYAVMDTEKLVAFVEKRCGVRAVVNDELDRIWAFGRAAMSTRRNEKDGEPDILADVLARNPIAAVKQIIGWRDALKLSGYDFKTKGVSKRLDRLNAIEKKVQDDPNHYGIADRVVIASLIARACYEESPFADVRIITPTNPKNFHPAVYDLIRNLVIRGATLTSPWGDWPQQEEGEANYIAHKISQIDILDFDDKRDADAYLAIYADKFGPDAHRPSLWISPDNGQHDNWRRQQGKKTMGGATHVCAHDISMNLVRFIRAMRTPVDVTALIDWLQTSFNPFPSQVSSSIAQAIADYGGYDNQMCMEMLDNFIATGSCHVGAEPQESEAESDKFKDVRRELLDGFLPDVQMRRKPKEDMIIKLRAFGDWAGKCYANEGDDPTARRLFVSLGRKAILLGALLSLSKKSEPLDWDRLLAMAASLCDTDDISPLRAQAGCPTRIEVPGAMAAQSDHTVWMLQPPTECRRAMDCDFLTQAESEALVKKTPMRWSRDAQRAYIREQTMLPFRWSERVTLVNYTSKYGVRVEPDPLIIEVRCLALAAGLDPDDMRQSPRITDVRELTSPIAKVDNLDDDEPEIRVAGTDKIIWPKLLQRTNFESLIFHPFTTLAQGMLGIRNVERPHAPTFDDVERVKAMFAGSIIRAICKAEATNARRTMSAADLRKKIEDIGDMVSAYKDQHAALLRDQYAEKQLAAVMGSGLSNLADFMERNDLCIVDSGVGVHANLGLYDYESDDNDTTGEVDILLYDNKKDDFVLLNIEWNRDVTAFVRDFSETGNIGLSLNLVMARCSLCVEGWEPKRITRSACLLLPEGRLYSCFDFGGPGYMFVQVGENPLPKLVNSFRFRKEQFDHGIIETAEELPPDITIYGKAAEQQKLLPLRTKTVRLTDGKTETQIIDDLPQAYRTFYRDI